MSTRHNVVSSALNAVSIQLDIVSNVLNVVSIQLDIVSNVLNVVSAVLSIVSAIHNAVFVVLSIVSFVSNVVSDQPNAVSVLPNVVADRNNVVVLGVYRSNESGTSTRRGAPGGSFTAKAASRMQPFEASSNLCLYSRSTVETCPVSSTRTENVTVVRPSAVFAALALS